MKPSKLAFLILKTIGLALLIYFITISQIAYWSNPNDFSLLGVIGCSLFLCFIVFITIALIYGLVKFFKWIFKKADKEWEDARYRAKEYKNKTY